MDLSTSLLRNLTTIQGMKSKNKEEKKYVAGKASNESVNDIPKDICDKISHSRVLLMENPEFVTFENKIPVLIKNDNFEQNKRRLKNYLMGKNKDIEPYTVTGFYSTFF